MLFSVSAVNRKDIIGHVLMVDACPHCGLKVTTDVVALDVHATFVLLVRLVLDSVLEKEQAANDNARVFRTVKSLLAILPKVLLSVNGEVAVNFCCTSNGSSCDKPRTARRRD